VTETTGNARIDAEQAARRMRAIADGLAARGMITCLHDSRAGLDVTASLRLPGRREAELVVDEDGYAELRYWYPPDADPEQVTATALRALAAVTGGKPAGG
jgi:hypothetical protein